MNKHRNTIFCVQDRNGQPHTDYSPIETVFLNHYSSIWDNCNTLSFFELLQALPSNLLAFTSSNSDFLTRKVSKLEIYRALMSLPLGKSLGMDGFNIEFFKYYQHGIEENLFNVVTRFFNVSNPLNSWSITNVVLIPKKDNPKVVSDYRPISLCNVCYKIIAKILANRLKFILPNIIGKEQADFIRDCTSTDKIIVIQEVVHTLNQDLNMASQDNYKGGCGESL